MQTKIIDTMSGKEYIVRDLPLLQIGMLISLPEAFAARRVTDVWLSIGMNEDERAQTIFAGVSSA